ncbi:PilZ domain-containing protein [Sphingomonas sp. LY160]|uniref:PilZ domain-containing protein n=1 Tax=Sphingomonas sp. LY160 TaxID=3095342 RepID=UPI002ADEF840|nr:PilZ domain-containing protein [Sphingomonas sp. LY160]MEA1072996.1 PilZ domain-containing protein [Sphingomonas sp. LY160]
MNKFRSAILSGKGLHGDDPVVRDKSARGVEPDDLSSIEVTREATRAYDGREEDRHRLTGETATLRHIGAVHQVELINLSGGGAMVSAEFGPRLWDRVDLVLAEDAELECAVRWLRGDRVGLEFAHETRIECDAAKRDALLLDVVRRSFPDIKVEQEAAPAPVVSEDDDAIANSRRTERRHPLIWMGEILFQHNSERVRLRNISEHGALVESPLTYPIGAELLLDLGAAGQHFATVGWTCGDKVGLAFAQPFDLSTLAQVRPDVASGRPSATIVPRVADDDSPWADGWRRQSVEELRESLEGYLKR